MEFFFGFPISDVGSLLDFTYSFNAGTSNNGNVASIANNRNTARTQSFSYDELNRIKTAQTSSTTGQYCWGETFGYDIWANLLTIGAVSGYTGCTQENLSVAATTKNQISGDTYDSAGNLITIPSVANYTYDAENHLLTAGGVTYTYDGDGKRVKKSNGKLYWYGMSSDPTTEADSAGNNPVEYVFFGGKRIARRDSAGAVSYYFADHLGSSRVVTNSTGTVLDDSDFYPFGGERVVSASSGNAYKFTSKERDSESGLDNFGARYDSSSMGRFMSPDPLLNSGRPWQPQSWNRYAYTLNNPLKFIDPTGLYDLVNNCAQDDKKCNKKFNENAERLKKGVEDLRKKLDKVKDPVQKARLEAALKALGTKGDHNGVNVSFGALKGDASGETKPFYNVQTGKVNFNVTFDPSKISSTNDQAIDAAHEGTHISDISDPRYNNPNTTLSDFSLEYRGYQTSAWAASALGETSLAYGNGKYPIWNSSWGAIDDKMLTRYLTSLKNEKGQQTHPETTPNNPWDN